MEPLEAFRTQRWGPRALGEVKEDRVAPFNEDTTRTWPPMSRKITRTLIKDLGFWPHEKILEAVRAVHAEGGEDRISQHRNIGISALASCLCISNSALLQNPLKVGSGVHISKKSPGNADVAIWRAPWKSHSSQLPWCI